jgi:hypothetical protein
VNVLQSQKFVNPIRGLIRTFVDSSDLMSHDAFIEKTLTDTGFLFSQEFLNQLIEYINEWPR